MLCLFSNVSISFVDRDMYMRYRGGGVGHIPTKFDEEAAGSDIELEEDDDLQAGQSGDIPDVDDEAENSGDEDEDGIDGDGEADDMELDRELDDGCSEDEGDIEGDRDRIREEITDDLGFSEL